MLLLLLFVFQELGDEREECVVYHITLKRVRYGSHSSTDSSPTSHLQWISEKVKFSKSLDDEVLP